MVTIILKKSLQFSYREIYKNMLKMILPTISMILVLVLSMFVKVELNLVNSIIKLLIFGLLSAFIYMLISYKNGIIKDIFRVDLIQVLKNKLKKTSN